jgi:hypothetical protein
VSEFDRNGPLPIYELPVSLMPFLAECMLCRQKVRLPDKATGASIQCPRCGSYFTAAPEERLMSAAKRQEPPSPIGIVPPPPSMVVASSPRVEPEPATDMPASAFDEAPDSTPQPALRLPVFPVSQAQRSGIEPIGIDPIGLGAIVVAGLAGWCTTVFMLTILVIPLAILGFMAGLAGLAAGLLRDRPRWVLATIGTVANLALFVAALFVPSWLGGTYQLSRERVEPEIATPRVVPLPGKAPAEGEPVPEWPDATRFSVHIKSVRIQVVSAEVRPLEIATTPKKKYTQESYLVLRIRAHQAPGGAEFASDAWGQEGTAQERRQPTLTDESGKSYQPAPAHLGGEAGTLTKRSTDFPLGITDEVYLFEAPAPGTASLRLEIPAAGWGGTGTVRFAIPRKMLQSRAAPGGAAPSGAAPNGASPRVPEKVK